MPGDPVRGKARARYPEPSYEEQMEAMTKVAGGGKVIVTRVYTDKNTFGGQVPAVRAASSFTAQQITVLLDEEHQRHKSRVAKIIGLLALSKAEGRS